MSQIFTSICVQKSGYHLLVLYVALYNINRFIIKMTRDMGKVSPDLDSRD